MILRTFSAIAVALLATILIAAPSAATEKKKEEEWKGKLADGTIITKADLSKILMDHGLWLRTRGKEDKKIRKGARADLTKADLRWADLHKANLSEANLRGADLFGADLNEIDLNSADLREANLIETSLAGGYLRGADLRGAYLDLADLTRADLRGADLAVADLSAAILRWTNLSGADLSLANLSHAVFEPELGGLPAASSIAWARNLHLMRYFGLSNRLMELREVFKKAGLRDQERDITYAINHTKRLKVKEDLGEILDRTGKYEDTNFLTNAPRLASKSIGSLFFLLFEATCQYGRLPGRPLWLLFWVTLFCTIPYAFALRKKQRYGGIWQVWHKDRIHKDEGGPLPVRLRTRRLGVIGYGLYFSILSAFHFGWRDLNVGNWIARIQLREYSLRATGWVRLVSGIQSLISIFLLALESIPFLVEIR